MKTIILTIILITTGCATDDGVPLHEWATQTHDEVGNVGDVVYECFAASPADADYGSGTPPGEAAAMDFAEEWIAACDQWVAPHTEDSPACSMSYWPTGRDCD